MARDDYFTFGDEDLDSRSSTAVLEEPGVKSGSTSDAAPSRWGGHDEEEIQTAGDPSPEGAEAGTRRPRGARARRASRKRPVPARLLAGAAIVAGCFIAVLLLLSGGGPPDSQPTSHAAPRAVATSLPTERGADRRSANHRPEHEDRSGSHTASMRQHPSRHRRARELGRRRASHRAPRSREPRSSGAGVVGNDTQTEAAETVEAPPTPAPSEVVTEVAAESGPESSPPTQTEKASSQFGVESGG
jgi:hypothetical protein